MAVAERPVFERGKTSILMKVNCERVVFSGRRILLYSDEMKTMIRRQQVIIIIYPCM